MVKMLFQHESYYSCAISNTYEVEFLDFDIIEICKCKWPKLVDLPNKR